MASLGSRGKSVANWTAALALEQLSGRAADGQITVKNLKIGIGTRCREQVSTCSGRSLPLAATHAHARLRTLPGAAEESQ